MKGIPTQWKGSWESQLLCFHIPMNRLSDKLTISLYGNIANKLQSKTKLLSGACPRGSGRRAARLFQKSDAEQVVRFLVIQESKSIGGTLVEIEQADQDQGKNTDQG